MPSGLLIVGDNGSALHELQAQAGKVKLCYLDPPYNTGGDFAHYRDRQPAEVWRADLESKLAAIAPLLTADGSVWLHLDDREQHNGRVALDRVFGSEAFVATIIWEKRTSRDNRPAMSRSHEYIHVYAPMGPRAWKRVRNGLPNDAPLSNPDNDPRGPWRSAPMTAPLGGRPRPAQVYEVRSPAGAVHLPPTGRCWAYTRPRFEELAEAGRIHWPRGGSGKPRLKMYASELGALTPHTLWTAAEVGDTGEAKKELLASLPGMQPFDTPKPSRLMKRIIAIATNPGDLVLDPYLGSGTTAIAAHVLERAWIGIEREAATVERIILPRFANVGIAHEDFMLSTNPGAVACKVA